MAKISPEEIAHIREQADIVEIIGDYIPLTMRGKNYFGVCPFHQDHSPSMSVSREKQMYKCFSCGAAGNVFKFVSEYENISFIEAVAKVAAKIGISLNISASYKPVSKFAKEYEIMNLATLFYQNNLNTEFGLTAREYLHDRGITDEMIQEFQIGLSFQGNQLRDFLEKKGILKTKMLELGLVNQKNQEYNDVFNERILFPIQDASGQVVAYTGRVYEKGKIPKYLNSRETFLFRKGNILFNYHRAKEAIRLLKNVVLVEGNMDAIRMYVCGFKNTIALMGTSMTKEQIELLKKLHVPVTLMFDNDEAGKLATITNGNLLKNAGVEVLVIRLTNEKDPDEYILKRGVEVMQDTLKHPVSYLEFLYEALKENKDLTDATALASYVKSVLASLENADPITVDVVLNKLVQEFNLSYEVLKSELKEPKTTETIEVKPIVKAKKNRYQISVEHLLYAMMNDVKYIKMYQSKLGYFKEENYRKIANEIIYYAENKKEMSFADFLTYVELSPLKQEMNTIITSIKDDEIDDTSIADYIYNIKQIMWEDEVQKLKQEQKKLSDMNEKERIGNKIVELMKKIQEMKIERSVK